MIYLFIYLLSHRVTSGLFIKSNLTEVENCSIFIQLKYSSPNRSKKKTIEPDKRAYLSENGGLGTE